MFWIIKVAFFVYLGFGAYLYLAQRAFLYFPVPERSSAVLPAEQLALNGETIKLWVLGGDRPDAVVYFGGNGEDVYWNADEFARTLPGHAVYLVNYRGYGGSSGEPTEAGLFADALALFDELQTRHRSVAVIGRSLGSAVAVYLARQRPVSSLVLITPPDSVLALASAMYPVYPVSLMLKDKFESIRHAPHVTAPTLVLMAAADRLVPLAHSQRLAAAFPPGTVEQVVLAGVGHNDLSGHADYWRRMAEFIQVPPR